MDDDFFGCDCCYEEEYNPFDALSFRLLLLNDGRFLCYWYYSIRVWDGLSSSVYETVLDWHCCIASLIELQSEGTIAFGANDGVITGWDIKQKKSTFTLKGHTAKVDGLLQNGINFLFSCSNDCSIKKWDISLSECLITLKLKNAANCIIQLTDGHLASGSLSQISIWDRRSFKETIIIEENDRAEMVLALLQLKDGRLVSLSCFKLQIWMKNTFESQVTIDLNCSSVIPLLIQVNSFTLAAFSTAGVEFFDLSTYQHKYNENADLKSAITDKENSIIFLDNYCKLRVISFRK